MYGLLRYTNHINLVLSSRGDIAMVTEPWSQNLPEEVFLNSFENFLFGIKK